MLFLFKKKKIRATLYTEKQSHHNSKQHRDCITFDQMSRCVLQSDSITITGTLQTCHFILLDHFGALELVLFYPILFLTFFFPEQTTCNPYSCIVFLFLWYHKCQVGNLKFIKDASQSQDLKIGLSYRHEPQKAMSCSFRERYIHNSEKEVLEPPVSGP